MSGNEKENILLCNEGKFEITDKNESALVRIEVPAYIENREEKELAFVNWVQGTAVYADEKNHVEITVEKKKDTLFYVRRRWKNLSDEGRRIQMIFRIYPCFEVEHYLIPCVSLNGNEFGDGLEPKGLQRDGKPWIFGYDRVSVPACTLTENGKVAVSLFASGESEASLCSSCSIQAEEKSGRLLQAIYHPVIESPSTYSDRDIYKEAYESFVELAPGECFVCGMYICVSRPKWKNYGICQTLDDALEIFGHEQDMVVPGSQFLWNASITYAKSLITDFKGKRGFVIGYLPDGKGGFAYRRDKTFELAWCGQNVLFCRMLIEDYIRNGHRENMDTAIEVLDNWVMHCISTNGLIAAYFRDYENLKEAMADTCNMGYGAYEFLRCYQQLKEIGIIKEEYMNVAKGVCDFFCGHFSETYGFGKAWKLTGECVDINGSTGAFIICPMVKLYELTGEKKYLQMAEKALDFYVKRDLDNFCCKAGALDTGCVDKESAAPFLISSLLLYEMTKKDVYLEYSKKAAYYITSWMFHYQPLYVNESDIVKLQVCVKGLTAVSTQHHHLDVYAALVVPYLRRLADDTGDERWRARAEMMWKATLQCIGNGELKVHGMVRPIGSQNEAIFHCRWSFGDYQKGSLNDWLVAWPCAFRLSVLAEHRSRRV